MGDNINKDNMIGKKTRVSERWVINFLKKNSKSILLFDNKKNK